MYKDLSREELIKLVDQIKSGDGTEEEIDSLIDLLMENVPDPQVSNLIFYDDLPSAEIVDRALDYKPIQL